MCSRRVLAVWWLLAAASCLPLCAADGAGSGAKTVDPAVSNQEFPCKTCHADITSKFYKNPHFRRFAAARSERAACESCHGPTQRHLEAGGGKSTIRAFTAMKPVEVIEACLSCHGRDFQRANIRRSEHTQHDISCTNCHSNHHPANDKNLLAKNQPDACYECHGDVRAQFDMPSKHRVNEGLMKCTDCHNPHGGFTPTFGMGQTSKMLNQAHGNEQPCLKCHVDKRGPFLFEHQAANVDGCVSCHRPHGSTNAKLLTRAILGTLCLECHTGTAISRRVWGAASRCRIGRRTVCWTRSISVARAAM